MGQWLHLTLPHPLPTSSRTRVRIFPRSLKPRFLSYCRALQITSLHPCHTSSRYWNLAYHFRYVLFFASEIFSFAIPKVVRMPLGKFLTCTLVILQSHDLHANFLLQLFSRWPLPSLRLTGYRYFNELNITNGFHNSKTGTRNRRLVKATKPKIKLVLYEPIPRRPQLLLVSLPLHEN